MPPTALRLDELRARDSGNRDTEGFGGGGVAEVSPIGGDLLRVLIVARLRRRHARGRGEPLWMVLILAAEAYVKALPRKDRARVFRRARSEARQLAQVAVESYEKELERKARQRKDG